jgi:hypothetical protein
MKVVPVILALLILLSACGGELPEAAGESVPRVERESGETGD